MSKRPYFVYITTNLVNTVLYTGQTNDLPKRIGEHRDGLVDGFTKRYKVHKLVYYEVADDRSGALYREKQIKGYSRQRKIELIESVNPAWEDLFNKLLNDLQD